MKFFDFKKNRPWAEDMTIIMQLGLTMAGCVLFCLWLGMKLDGWLGSGGVFTVVFILLGVAGGGAVCYRQIMEMPPPEKGHDKKRETAKNRPGAGSCDAGPGKQPGGPDA